MSLSSRIKEMLGTESSAAAQRGSVDHNMPGYFPSDEAPRTNNDYQDRLDQAELKDSPLSASRNYSLGGTVVEHHDTEIAGSEHNKLHKKNDPKSTTSVPATTEKPQYGHGHTDSGIGIPDSSSDQSLPVRESPAPAAPVASVPAQIGRAEDRNRSMESTSGAATDAAAPSETHNVVANGRAKSNIERDDPYWGTLSQGAGTYNTVIGNGSGEDTSVPHRPVSHGEEIPDTRTIGSADALPHGVGVYNTVIGHGSERDDSILKSSASEKDNSQAFAADAAVDGSVPRSGESDQGNVQRSAAAGGSTRQVSSVLPTPADKYETGTSQREFPLQDNTKADTVDDETGSGHSKMKEYLAEAGMGAGAGAAVYGISQARRDDEELDEKNKPVVTDGATKHSKEDETKSKSDEKVGGKALGFIRRSKSPKDDHKKQEAHDDVTIKSADDGSKKKGILGVFHRQKDGKDEVDNTKSESTTTNAAEPSRQQPVTQASVIEQPAITVTHNTKDTYSPSRDLDQSDNAIATVPSQSTIAEKATVGFVGHNTKDTYSSSKGLERSNNTTTTVPPQNTITEVPAAGLVSNNTKDAYASSQDLDQGDNTTTAVPSQNPATETQLAETSDTSNAKQFEVAAGAAGLGAGAGAAYGISKLANNKANAAETTSVPRSSAQEDLRSTPDVSPTTHGNGSDNVLDYGTLSGIPAVPKSSAPENLHSTADVTRATDDSGQYNVLNSGTPSGVHIEKKPVGN